MLSLNCPLPALVIIAILGVATPVSAANLPRLGGVNMAGMEFGVGIDGSTTGYYNTYPPMDQIPQFTGEGVNLFRFPLGWQYAQPTLNGALATTYMNTYDTYVNRATSAGAYVIVDVHNYARRNGQIIGQSALTDASLVDLWKKLANRYRGNSKVIFGIMNEPHDLTLSTWINTAQTVVTAIRTTGATNYILIPGDNWTGLASFPNFYNAGLGKIRNLDGSYTNLIFDVHRYLDTDGSGTHTDCVSNRVPEVTAAASILSAAGRQAILSEVGGGNTASCETLLPQMIQAVVSAYPAFAGFAVWSAGSFNASTYELSVVPTGSKDTPIWNSIKKFLP